MRRNDLIESFESFWVPKFQNVGPGIRYDPSVIGFELFLWGFGLGNLDINKFFAASTKYNR
jgi:hypothetical protein